MGFVVLLDREVIVPSLCRSRRLEATRSTLAWLVPRAEIDCHFPRDATIAAAIFFPIERVYRTEATSRGSSFGN